jgi:hypothetical protein
MAACGSTVQDGRIEYHHLVWGEVIYGSKEDLQALGIAQGCAFPGESGGPKRQLSITDPRGFPCRIKREHGAHAYVASISFPGREMECLRGELFAHGVTRRQYPWGDLYEGSAESLVTAGLIQRDQLPGMPGLGKTVVHLAPDGSATDKRLADRVGAKTVRKISEKRFSVGVYVSAQERSDQLGTWARAQEDYDRKMRALPRPAPLRSTVHDAEAKERRAKMHLAWSRPAFIPTLTLPDFRPAFDL